VAALAAVGYVPALVSLLGDLVAASVTESEVLVPLLRALGNVVAVPDERPTTMLIAAGGLPLLLAMLQAPARNVRVEAAWVFSNMAGNRLCLTAMKT
jgi:hypothetical protein